MAGRSSGPYKVILRCLAQPARRYRPRRHGAPEIVPFADEHLDGAARSCWRSGTPAPRGRAAAARGHDFREHIEREWRTEGASGAVALENGETVGYLIGQRRDDRVGPHIWSYIAGQAVRTPELDARSLPRRIRPVGRGRA